MGDRVAFSLSTGGGAQSRWVEIGQSFRGHKLERYDREKQTLYLKDDTGKEIVIALSSSNYQPDDVDALTKAEEVIRLSNFEKMIKEGLTAQRDAMTQNMKQLVPGNVDPDAYADLQKRTYDLMIEMMDFEAIEEGMTEAYATIFTPEELDGFLDFYSTAAGKASLEKMPEIQQKSMEVMMPELMKAIPRIPELSQEWAAQQTAQPTAEE